MNGTQKAQIMRYFRAIGQPERLKILGLTANRPYTVNELAETLGLRETAVTHHLKRLGKLALVVQQDETVQFNRQALAALETLTAPAEGGETETAVLHTFIEDNRIRQFPADAAARRVLLNWLVDKFTPGRKYSRGRVEYMLQQHTPDVAWAQRQLIDAKLLQERNNIFQRTTASKEVANE